MMGPLIQKIGANPKIYRKRGVWLLEIILMGCPKLTQGPLARIFEKLMLYEYQETEKNKKSLLLGKTVAADRGRGKSMLGLSWHGEEGAS